MTRQLKISLFFSLLLCQPIAAQDAAAPLTLQQALAQAETSHPTTEMHRQDLKWAEANGREVLADSDLNISINAYARWIQPGPESVDQRNQDHQVSLVISKKLYDFGKQTQLASANRAQVDSMRSTLLTHLEQRKISITRAFFDIILADLAAFGDSEAMTVAFLGFDRLRERQELGQTAELEVLKAQAEYQKFRVKLLQTQALQRTSRAELASLLGQPENLPASVQKPDLSWARKKKPDFDILVQLAMEHNPQIISLKDKINASQFRLTAVSRDNWPSISSEFELSEYYRQIGSRDDWRASIILHIPVYSGDRVSSQAEQEMALLQKLKAELHNKQFTLRQEILQFWTHLETLRIQMEHAEVNSEYLELNLDQARTLYEQNKQVRMGDALTLTSEGRWYAAKTEFELGLTWLTLEALTGQPLSISQGAKNGANPPANN